MTSWLHRLTSALKEGTRALLVSADDPRAMSPADPALQHQRLLARVQQARLDQATARARLGTRLAELQARLPGLETQARRAVAAHHDDAARLALQQRQITLREAQALETQVADLHRDEQRLAEVEQRLVARLEVWRSQQVLTAARYTAAEAQVRVHEALFNFSDELTDLGPSLDQAEHRAEQMQARALALDSLLAETSVSLPGWVAGDGVSQQLAQLDLEREIEAELQALKQTEPNN